MARIPKVLSNPLGITARIESWKASRSHVRVFLGQVLSRTYTGSSRAMANTEDTRKTVLITG